MIEQCEFLFEEKVENLEIWKDISGFEGLYQVSNMGRVRSVDRVVVFRTFFMPRKSQIIGQRETSTGYFDVIISKGSKQTLFKVHKLVAENFIENPHNYKLILHKNGDRLDNHAENLEFVPITHGKFNKVESLPNEIWKSIDGYEGWYEISDLGRVKTTARVVASGNGHRIITEKIIKQRIDNNGYYYFVLSKESQVDGFHLHRLLGLTFLFKISR